MAEHSEVIRKQMEETRSQLTDKLEALESQVGETVQTTSAAVSETVQAVSETVENVSETVETVKETVENVAQSLQETVQSLGELFDLELQTDRHPWLIFGGSVALGCLAAQMFGKPEQATAAGHFPGTGVSAGSVHRQANEGLQASAQSTTSSNGTSGWFWGVLGRLRGVAVGSLMGMVRDVAARELPGSLAQQVAEEIDRLTPELGGEVMKGPIFPNKE
jgi:uncharacterized protein YoxC